MTVNKSPFFLGAKKKLELILKKKIKNLDYIVICGKIMISKMDRKYLI